MMWFAIAAITGCVLTLNIFRRGHGPTTSAMTGTTGPMGSTTDTYRCSYALHD